jgi:hypothetical protein
MMNFSVDGSMQFSSGYTSVYFAFLYCSGQKDGRCFTVISVLLESKDRLTWNFQQLYNSELDW